jgi:hypothetical protein
VIVEVVKLAGNIIDINIIQMERAISCPLAIYLGRQNYETILAFRQKALLSFFIHKRP